MNEGASSLGWSETTLVAPGVEVCVKLSEELFWLEQPVIVTNKCHLFRPLASRFLVKEVASSDEGVRLPPIGVHAIYCSCFFLAIDCHSLINTLLVNVQVFESQTHVLVSTFYDLHSVRIDLSNRANRCAGITQSIEECPASSLHPIEFATEVMLGDDVLVRLESEWVHFITIKLIIIIK